MRVDFYVLQTDTPEVFWLTACRLLEKAYRQGHQVFVFCSHQQDAEHLDELLWTFKPDSFIPHHLQGEGPEPPPAIQIGYGNEPRGFHDILLNLSSEVPPFMTRFKRIIEIVPSDETGKTRSREHFRLYRKAGIEPQTHTIE
ncbi:MAG: DNA polymerase III subunit chi [Legionella sp.]|nr:MAG: DNA polymerase III subunit chi [Legionella sp.]